MKNTKFHPILFSTPMVQGIIEDRKTKTRRTKGLENVNLNPNEWKFECFGTNPEKKENDKNSHAYFTIKGTETWMHVKCPYNVGDILWVRETFSSKEVYDEPPGTTAHYKASDCFSAEKWKPSIFMPKQACRIFLKIKSIRVERLNEISEEDAKTEGIEFVEGIDGNIYYNYLTLDYFTKNKILSFMTLWQSINGTDSWKHNPFVWVYEFEKIEKPLDFI
jgi:hypothetical protein